MERGDNIVNHLSHLAFPPFFLKHPDLRIPSWPHVRQWILKIGLHPYTRFSKFNNLEILKQKASRTASTVHELGVNSLYIYCKLSGLNLG